METLTRDKQKKTDGSEDYTRRGKKRHQHLYAINKPPQLQAVAGRVLP